MRRIARCRYRMDMSERIRAVNYASRGQHIRNGDSRRIGARTVRWRRSHSVVGGRIELDGPHTLSDVGPIERLVARSVRRK
jgi:hypothetical protein